MKWKGKCRNWNNERDAAKVETISATSSLLAKMREILSSLLAARIRILIFSTPAKNLSFMPMNYACTSTCFSLLFTNKRSSSLENYEIILKSHYDTAREIYEYLHHTNTNTYTHKQNLRVITIFINKEKSILGNIARTYRQKLFRTLYPVACESQHHFTLAFFCFFFFHYCALCL